MTARGFFAAAALGIAAGFGTVPAAASTSASAPEFNPVRDSLVAAGKLNSAKSNRALQGFCTYLEGVSQGNPAEFYREFYNGNTLVQVYLCSAADHAFKDLTEYNRVIDHGRDGATPKMVQDHLNVSVDAHLEVQCRDENEKMEEDEESESIITDICEARAITDSAHLVLEEALMANPHLSQEVQGKVEQSTVSNLREALAAIASGKMQDGDAQSCGMIGMAFKDDADKGYGVLAFQFDRQGNITNLKSAAPGSPYAISVTTEMKANQGTGPMMYDGHEVVTAYTGKAPCLGQ